MQADKYVNGRKQAEQYDMTHNMTLDMTHGMTHDMNYQAKF